MSKINLCIFLLCSILTACVSSNSYFVRFWNGDVIPERPYEELEVISLKVMDCISHDKLKEKEK